jgi:hypothetical protein
LAGRGPNGKTKINEESPTDPGTSRVAVKNAPADLPATATSSAIETNVSPPRTASWKFPNAKGRGRPVAITVENSDQLLGLLEGPAATTAKGKVTVNAKAAARREAGNRGRTQPNESLNLPASPKENRRDSHGVDSSNSSTETAIRTIAGRRND